MNDARNNSRQKSRFRWVLPILGLWTLLAIPTHASEAASGDPGTPLEVAQAFMMALGGGDMEALDRLVAEDMVWHNEGDKSIPWIGPWSGKKEIFEKFLPAYGAGAQTKMWKQGSAAETENEAFLTGSMSLLLTASGQETGPTSWAVKVRVKDGQVVHWHWFEDSLLISRAFHGEFEAEGAQ